jgi:hypothetical protein
MNRRILYLGGNGHSSARLAPAEVALTRLTASGAIRPFQLLDVPYPGFENRPRAASLDAFLDNLSRHIADLRAPPDGQTLLYGTGIGGLLLLCLRSRGEWLDLPILLQGAVLWGVKARTFPQLMRLGLARLLLRRLFLQPLFQEWFVRRKFLRPLAPELHRAFFQGYEQCTAMADFFEWLTPRLLHTLQRRFQGSRAGLDNILAWWGEHDRVVTLRELLLTQRALRVRWPLRRFANWGHYPMLDDPDDWVRTLDHELATLATLPRPLRSQAE